MKLSRVQWISIILLILGVSIAQLSNQKSNIQVLEDKTSISSVFIGSIITIIACVLSGCAGVYQEKVLKKFMTLNINYLNIQVLLFIIFFINIIVGDIIFIH